LELYKSKHINNQSFVFFHCGFLLKDVPRWADFQEDVKKTSNLKQPTLVEQYACAKFETLEPPPPMTYGGSSF
jgi:hypothetical protein